MADLIPFLFWEKQEGYLCAQHCLNSLLQGEYFTAVDLGEIGRRLDQAEHDAMTSPDQQQNSQQQPNTRFFSVQESVLNMALEVWNIEMVPIGSEAGRGSRSQPEFTLRKFGGLRARWYNLDSLLKGPEWISPTYLGMLLNQLENNGYSIFVIKGDLPISQADENASKLPDPDTVNRIERDKSNLQEIDQEMMNAAIAASLGNSNDNGEEKELK
ncbi:2926_t:CDS:2 [Entrophospora sp. SA101]|nr:2926_t:CDS:2 [Entrophospora sp. SA101]CAJ0858145.1 2165_t:CDS:2 [Entrophospora sp. SA101]